MSMATLTREKIRPRAEVDIENNIAASVPAPFPTEVFRSRMTTARVEDALAIEAKEEGKFSSQQDAEMEKESKLHLTVDLNPASTSKSVSDSLENDTEMHPSMRRVEQACLTTLNNLLTPENGALIWKPIIPSRRHSMPHRNEVSATSSTSPLVTLLENLRSLNSNKMLEIGDFDDSASLYKELREHIRTLSPSLSARDQELAFSLVSLLSRLDRLSVISPDIPDNQLGATPIEPYFSNDIYAALSRQVSAFQSQRMDASTSSVPHQQPVQAVESALLWNSIDTEFESVLRLCHQSYDAATLSYGDSEHLLPGYEDMDGEHELPQYDYEDDFRDVTHAHEKRRTSLSTMITGDATNEKMKLDLDSVIMAIERFYIVAPQLNNQRAELRKGKLEELARARERGPDLNGKSRISDAETRPDQLLELIAKASSRRLADQSFVVDGGMEKLIERARLRDLEKRREFVEHLLDHSSTRRMTSQDALPPSTTPRLRDPEELISLPDFIREPVPAPVNDVDHSKVASGSSSGHKYKSGTVGRSRSLSAPSFAWLLPGARAPSPKVLGKMKTHDSGEENIGTFTIQYVAEHQEALSTVSVLLQVASYKSVKKLEAETIPTPGKDDNGCQQVVLKVGSQTSPPITLPMLVNPGQYSVTSFPEYHELRLPAHPTHTLLKNGSLPMDSQSLPSLLTAEKLTHLSPSSFLCNSCSLPLIRFSGCNSETLQEPKYADLPSEYWAELLDAWMCHTDQKLNDTIAQHANGIWPLPRQILVGVSYILVSDCDVVKENLKAGDMIRRSDWRMTRCLCGAVVGRSQEVIKSDSDSTVYYRFAKHCVRVVSASYDRTPVRLSMSAFFVEDMHAIALAHATWRFVIHDEEEDKPRFLIWLFKPSIRMSWVTPSHRVLPRSGSQLSAKVLFKILNPNVITSELDQILSKHPGFNRADYLSYPRDTCRRLAALLKESNLVYPEGLRQMTGLDVGWLQRAPSYFTEV